MKRILVPRLPTSRDPVEVPEQEAHHALQVMRLRNGERVLAMDGKGGLAVAKLRVRGKSAILDFEAEAQSARESAIQELEIELAVLKGDAMEWAIEKCVELGVKGLTPVLTAHTVVQLDRKGPEEFRQRWQRIADQSLKQCGRVLRMEIHEPVRLDVLLGRPLEVGTSRIWCDDQGRREAIPLADWLDSIDPGTRVRALIGPEGGFSDSERELLRRSGVAISLGELTLRAETAAIAVAAVTAAKMLDRKAQKKDI